jgi:hypothetical protein
MKGGLLIKNELLEKLADKTLTKNGLRQQVERYWFAESYCQVWLCKSVE